MTHRNHDGLGNQFMKSTGTGIVSDPHVPGVTLDNVDITTNADNTDSRLNVSSILTDRLGRANKISQKGEMLIGMNVDDVDTNFQYIVRTAETTATVTGTGVVDHPGAIGAYAQLSPGAGVGRAQLVSKASVRYRAGHESYCELSWIYATPEVSNWREFCGFVNGSDQLLVGYENDQFGILFTEGGNETFVPQTTFNFDKIDGTGPSGYTINPQAINVFRLSFVWHGGLPLTVEVQVGMSWWPVHVFDFSNLIAETHLENPHLPIGGFIERTAGTGPASIGKTGSWRGGSIAGNADERSDDWTGHTTLDATLVSSLRTNIMTLHNPMTWQGKQNHIVYELGVISFSSSANKDTAIYGNKNATLNVGGDAITAITDIDVNNYALQWQEGGTVTGGTRGPATILKAGGERRTDVRGTGIKVYPGESFTIEVDAGGPVNGSFSMSTRFIHEG